MVENCANSEFFNVMQNESLIIKARFFTKVFLSTILNIPQSLAAVQLSMLVWEVIAENGIRNMVIQQAEITELLLIFSLTPRLSKGSLPPDSQQVSKCHQPQIQVFNS